MRRGTPLILRQSQGGIDFYRLLQRGILGSGVAHAVQGESLVSTDQPGYPTNSRVGARLAIFAITGFPRSCSRTFRRGGAGSGT